MENPTRIYSGVRFAVRLAFQMEPQTEEFIPYAINSGVYDRTSQENSKTPVMSPKELQFLAISKSHLKMTKYLEKFLVYFK